MLDRIKKILLWIYTPPSKMSHEEIERFRKNSMTHENSDTTLNITNEPINNSVPNSCISNKYPEDFKPVETGLNCADAYPGGGLLLNGGLIDVKATPDSSNDYYHYHNYDN